MRRPVRRKQRFCQPRQDFRICSRGNSPTQTARKRYKANHDWERTTHRDAECSLQQQNMISPQPWTLWMVNKQRGQLHSFRETQRQSTGAVLAENAAVRAGSTFVYKATLIMWCSRLPRLRPRRRKMGMILPRQ